MRNKTFPAAAVGIALIASHSANANNWYIAAADGTCISGELLDAAAGISALGRSAWASPYALADGLKILGAGVQLQTTQGATREGRKFLMVTVRVGAYPNDPTIDHSNFIYFNSKEACLEIVAKVH